MRNVEEECQTICGGRESYRIDLEERRQIASTLAQYLLDSNAVNTVWNCDPKYKTKDTIISYLVYLGDDTIGQLMAKGLDLNLEIHNGITQFTWMIGNAENYWANELLKMSDKYQTREQRLGWINKIDFIRRYRLKPMTSRFFSSQPYLFSYVNQTALQLVIAKGYENKSGSGYVLRTSNLQLAEELLKLGADEGINYQEPGYGHTALHIAYARRDLNAIKLLESYGASQEILNRNGKKPSDMLSLTFDQVKNLLEFHTSPDKHPKTFFLDEHRFNDRQELAKIRSHIANEKESSSNNPLLNKK